MSQKLSNEIKTEFEVVSGINCIATFMDKGERHTPTSLIRGEEKGVYVFLLNEKCCFKVGKAGADSLARWNSQHYNLDKTTPSTFTKSLLNDLPNFVKYFDGEARSDLEGWHQILNDKLGTGYSFNIGFLKGIDKELFNEVKCSIPIKEWIRENLCRMEFKISNDDSRNYDLDLLEKFVAFKLRPIYEG